MNRFAYVEARSYEEASSLIKDKRYSLPVLKAGGLDVLDHMKEGLARPDALVNVRRLLPVGMKDRITQTGSEIAVIASATMVEVAASDIVRKAAPVIAQTLLSAATPQVRNVATMAGNLLQRPRCWYYRAAQFDCLKKGGSTCFAVEGENKFHAIFGDGPCHIVHPSNLAPALMVSDGVVHLTGSDRKSLPIAALFHMPGTGVTSEHTLQAGEVITHITFKPRPVSGFYAVKEKQSFDWPLVFACVSLEVAGNKISKAEVCAGAVAPVPWPLPKVAAALAGVSIDDDKALTTACALAVAGAKPMRDNSYKLRLLPVAIKRAILRATGKPIPGEEGQA